MMSNERLEAFKNGEISITMEAVIVLSLAGVSLDIESWLSALQPEGKLLRAITDGKGTVRLFDKEGNKHQFEFEPTEWFRDSSLPSKS